MRWKLAAAAAALTAAFTLPATAQAGHLVEARVRLEQTDQPLPLLRETLDNIGRTLQHGPPL